MQNKMSMDALGFEPTTSISTVQHVTQWDTAQFCKKMAH